PKDDELPYNTLAHAVTILSGRLEMGPGQADPACGGIPAWDLVQGAYGSSLTARSKDRGPTTGGQVRAVTLIDANGIVLPQTTLDTATPTQIRDGVKNQALINAAARNGIAPATPEYTDFVTNQMGAVVASMVDGIPDADLRFALNRSLVNYRLLTQTGEDVDVSVQRAGLKLASQNSGVAGLGGIVLDGGTPTQDIAGDVTALTAGITGASQCASLPAAEAYADTAGKTAFQDVYSLAQSLNRRLVVAREEAPPGSDAYEVANAASAEVSTWAGNGRIVASPIVDNGSIAGIWVEMHGVDPTILEGVTTNANSQIALVYGRSWVADCATKQRSSCPDDFEQDYMETPINLFPYSVTPRHTGFDGESMGLMFVVGAPEFNPVLVGESVSDEHLYVVLRSDPNRQSVGRVLAAIDLREDGQGTSSPMNGGAPTRYDYPVEYANGDIPRYVSYSGPPTHCLGLPKDMFVPLEAELTSNGDAYENSYRHYITLAMNAAQRADELGNKLLELGGQKELRREAAGEELANLCGTYAALDTVTFDKGRVIPPSDDEALRSCLDEHTIDIVFITEDQVAGMKTTPCSALRCPDSKNRLCTKCATPGAVSTAGLNILDSGLPPRPGLDRCNRVVSSFKTLKDGYKPAKLQEVLKDIWIRPEHIKPLVQSLQFKSDGAAIWSLTSAGRKIMDSQSNAEGLWPGCHLNYSIGCGSSNRAADVFDRMFREKSCAGSMLPTFDERALIRWRVEGALWTLAGMAKTVPAGLFEIWIPLANLGDYPDFKAPIPTIYGHGSYASSHVGTVHHLSKVSDTPEDSSILNDVHPMPSYLNSMDWNASVMPLWLRHIYQNHEKYYRTKKPNRQLKVGDDNNLFDFMDSVAKGLTDVRCVSNACDEVKLEGKPLNYAPSMDNTYDKLRSVRFVTSASTENVHALHVLCDPVKPNQSALLALHQSADFVGTDNVSEKTGIDFRNQLMVQYSEGAFDFELPKDVVPGYFLEKSTVDLMLFSQIFTHDPYPPYGAYMSLFKDYPYAEAVKSCSLRESSSTWMSYLGAACVYNEHGPIFDYEGRTTERYLYTHRVLQPKYCRPSHRVPAFINSYPPKGTCGAASQLFQATSLACEI
ncbi:MAG: hypothetical protein FWD57_14040, partial [Polyangiaceae bacterium]|nr:hypothetical protein [Polyangiaceae bacterium]